MGGGSTTSDTTTNQINQIPQWMSDAGQQNYAYAQNVAMQPLQQYQGQMVADVAPQTQQSWDVAANSGNVGADQYNAASAGYLNAMNTSPMMTTAAQSALANPVTAAQSGLSQTGSSNLGQYMNPYTSSVINATLPIMRQELGLSQDAQQNAASSANAFGGSRQGVQQGVTQAQGAMNMAQMAAQLNNANYNQARQASEFDVGQANNMGQFNANQANTVGLQNMNAANNMGQFNAGALNTTSAQNQAAQQAAVNSGIQASYGLTNTGDAMSKNNVANFNMLQSAGAGQSMQAQNEINSQMAKFNQAFNYPQQQLGVLESSLGMTPHDTSTSGQSNTTTTTPTDWASLVMGGAKTAAGLWQASDRSMKTDITKLGKDPKTGLEMHAYRYKGDPKSYPKVVGPMAQEVQEKYPDDVAKVGAKGKLAIKGYAGGTPFVLPNMTPASDMGTQSTYRMGGGADSRDEALGMAAAELRTLKQQQAYDRGMGREPRHYAGGTSMVPPSLAAFTPPSSPGVAKGIGALSAFRPPVRLPRGAGVPKMQKFAEGSSFVRPNLDPSDTSMGTSDPETESNMRWHAAAQQYYDSVHNRGREGPTKQYAFGTSDVPNMDDADLGDQIMGGDAFKDKTADAANNIDEGLSQMMGARSPKKAASGASQLPPGWGAPSMGYFRTGYAGGVSTVPGQGMEDTVPSMLTPGEAVLTPRAAQHVGRDKIAALNAMLPPVSHRSTSAPRAGARGISGALANTKRHPKVMGGLA